MKKNGFTLVELLITLTLCSVLFLSTIFSWNFFKYKNEQKVLIEEIKNAIQYAKISALSEGHRLQLISRTPDADWSRGMTLNSMENHLIHEWTWNHRNWSLEWQGVHGSKRIYIEGTTFKAMSNGHFILTNKQNNQKTVLLVNRLGRIRQT